MKQAPAFDAVVGKSHAVNTKCELRAPNDSLVGVLPVEAGTITADGTRRVDRWEGTLTLAGLDWAPQSATDPLAGLTGHYVSVQRAAQPYGDAETWVELCRLWVYETVVNLSRRDARCEVRLVGPGGLLERAVHDDYTAHRNDPAQQMIVSVLSEHLPYTPTVLDTSTPTNVPAVYEPKDVTPLQVADDLAAICDARVYFDALGRIVIRPTLPSLDVATLAPARQMGIKLDVTDYQITIGRDRFANDAVARFDWEDNQQQQQGRVGRATITSGPLAKDGPAGRLSVEAFKEIDATQAEADTYATAVLTSMKQAWCTVRIRAVQDPRIEPDDIVEVEYLDRTLRHRVVGVSFDLTHDAMEVTARTALPTGSP